jgi:hypothetical protein
VGECCQVADALGVVTDGDEELAGDVEADALLAGAGPDAADEERLGVLVELGDLRVEELDPSRDRRE